MKRAVLHALAAGVMVTTSLAGATMHAGAQTARNPYAQHMDISVGFINATDDIKPSAADPVLKAVEQKFNITIKPVEETWSNIWTQPPLWAASGQLPDILFTAAINTANYFQWINQGLIRPLPSDLGAYPYVNKVVHLHDFQGFKYRGKFWVFPRELQASNVLPGDRGIIIRKDWMAKLGLKDPQTWPQFVALLQALVQKNPDHSKNVTGVTTNNVGSFRTSLFNSWNPYPEWWAKNKAGRWVSPIEYPSMLTTIQMAHQLYTQGLLDKDWGNPNNNATTKFVEGQAAAIEWQPKHLDQLEQAWNQAHKDKKFTDVAKILMMPPGPNGRLVFEYWDFWSETTISSGVSDAKMSRILALYNYLISPEGRRLVNFGFPGKDFKMVGGAIASLHPRTWNVQTVYPSTGVLNSLAVWDQSLPWAPEFKTTNPVPATWSPGAWNMYVKYVRDVLKVSKTFPLNYSLNAYAQGLPHGNDTSATAFVQAVAASNPQKVWSQYVQQENNLGLAKDTAIVNQKFKTASLTGD